MLQMEEKIIPAHEGQQMKTWETVGGQLSTTSSKAQLFLLLQMVPEKNSTIRLEMAVFILMV